MLKLCGRGVALFAGSRARSLLLILGLGLLGFGPLAVATVRAQDTDRGPAAPASGGRTRRVRVTGGADDADATGGAESDGPGGTSRFDSREPFLNWMIRASGPIGLVIALMSFYLIALVVWMALNYRAPVAVPPELVHEVQGLLEQSKLQRGLSAPAGRPVVPGERAGGRGAQAAGGPGPGPARHGTRQRRRHDADGTPHDLSGNRGDARADDRAGRDRLRDDQVLPGHRDGGLLAPGQPARRGDLDGAVRHARGDRAVDPGDLLLRVVPQPDRAAVAGSGDDRRAPARAVRAGRAVVVGEFGRRPGRRAVPPGACPPVRRQRGAGGGIGQRCRVRPCRRRNRRRPTIDGG